MQRAPEQRATPHLTWPHQLTQRTLSTLSTLSTCTQCGWGTTVVTSARGGDHCVQYLISSNKISLSHAQSGQATTRKHSRSHRCQRLVADRLLRVGSACACQVGGCPARELQVKQKRGDVSGRHAADARRLPDGGGSELRCDGGAACVSARNDTLASLAHSTASRTRTLLSFSRASMHSVWMPR